MSACNKYDVLILGSGIAGLSLANYLIDKQRLKSENRKLKVLVVSKGEVNETNTAWAQGGVAAAVDTNDSIERHVNDTLAAGSYANDTDVTQKIISQAPEAIRDLIGWGVQFDKKSNGDFDLGLEGGHDHPRILHHQDITGAAIQHAIQEYFTRAGGEISNHTAAIDILKTVDGFWVTLFDLSGHKTVRIFCVHLVMATGGIGQLFTRTTNTRYSTGDGIYLSHQLGAAIKELAMVQFHPTGLYVEENSSFLISEALRGAGAELLDHKELPFMHRYDPKGSLAPRDIVSRAIWQEMRLSGKEHVWLDARMISPQVLQHHFSNIVSNCISRAGVDPAKDLIPVAPIQHYSCGGIATDANGRTTIKGLYAIGECAHTGLHGANRLASNSLLEGIVMAKFVAQEITGTLQQELQIPAEPAWELPMVLSLDISNVKKIFSPAAGVMRNTAKMKEALRLLEDIKLNGNRIPFNVQDFENSIILQVSILLLKDALSKKSSIGVHYIEA